MNFTEFWARFPAKSQHKGSKVNAEKLWNGLNMYDHHNIELSMPIYEAHLAENGWKKPMMVQTYLGPGRHWESFQPPEKVQGQIDEIEQRREKIREQKANEDAYAKQQWADRWERLHGYRPKV